jgi:hypothetical protein
MQLDDGRCQYRTDRSLVPGEAFIVMAEFPRVLRVTPSPHASFSGGLDPALKYGVLGLLLVAGYYLLVWWLVGRDPAPTAHVTPRFSPPDGLPPSALRYVWKLGYDTKVLAVTLVDLSINGVLTIVNHDKEFRLESEQTFYWDPERHLLQELAPGIPVDDRTLAKRLDEPVARIRAMVAALIWKGPSRSMASLSVCRQPRTRRYPRTRGRSQRMRHALPMIYSARRRGSIWMKTLMPWCKRRSSINSII